MYKMYLDNMQFQVKAFNKAKSISHSEQTISLFNQIVKYIRHTDDSRDLVIEKVKADVKVVIDSVAKDIVNSGDNKTTYPLEYRKFVCKCVFWLNVRFDLTQKEAGEFFGLIPNKFGKWNMYPIRGAEAYKMQENKSIFPVGWGSSESQDIAKVLNKRILAPYECKSFIAVTNKTEVYANTYHGHRKPFLFLTSAITDGEEFDVEEANYALARFLFFNLGGGNIKLKFEDIKNKIIDLLSMRDVTMSDEFFNRLIFKNGMDFTKYIRDRDEIEFNRLLRNYQIALETIRDGEEALETGDYSLVMYDERFGVFSDDMSISEQFERVRNNMGRERLSDEEIIKKYIQKNKEIAEDLRPRLIDNLDCRSMLNDKEHEGIYLSWLECIRDTVRSEYIMDNVKEKALVTAARFYLAEVLTAFNKKGQKFTFKDLEDLQTYLKTGDLLRCMTYIGAGDKKQLIGVLNLGGTLDSALEYLGKNYISHKDPKKPDNRHACLYIDTEDYDIGQEEIKKILDKYDVELVLRGKPLGGMHLLDEKLNLYINVEVD